MASYYYGCDEMVRGWARYTKLCNALEVDLSSQRDAPTIKTLNRWRVSSPRGFAFLLHMDTGVVEGLNKACDRGAKRLPASVREGWEVTQARAQALSAKAIVLSTSMDVTPGEASRALLAQLAELVHASKRTLIWEPSGLWERPQAQEWAREHGVTLAYDPFLAMQDSELCAAGEDVCWVVSERAGMRRSFDQFDLEGVLEWGSTAQRVFMMLRGRFKESHARELRYIMESLAPME